MTLTKRDLVIRIGEETPLTQAQVLDVIQKTLDYIAESLSKGDKVELRNFGVFEVKKRKARRARNPRTDEKVFVPEKNVVTFQPGKEMEERVRVEARVHEPKKKKGKGESTPRKPAAKKPAKPAAKAPAAPKAKKSPKSPPVIEAPIIVPPIETAPIVETPVIEQPVPMPTPAPESLAG